ncbi:MAG: radical SAM protein, partial [Elusimicrobia bacterium]|nr:radical SAM protein [Elusimicrobiota bacterium]
MYKILLISAPYIDHYGPIKMAAGRYFPLGLGYIAAILKRQKYEVIMCEPEAQCMSFAKIEQFIHDLQPDVIGISSATPNFKNAVCIARIAKRVSNAHVVYGGVHASAVPNVILENHRDCIDYIVIGEGEFVMLELVRHLEQRIDPFEVPGLVFIKDGSVVRTKSSVMINNLDILPLPARELLPQSLFRPNMHNIRYKQCATILTSRGCPFNCSFCASHLTMGKKYRVHSSEYVLEEMLYLKNQFNLRQLIINDDTFSLDKKRLINICEGMIRKKLNIEWFCFSQVSTMEKDILRLMRKAGCYNIGFGIESASSKTLSSMGKKRPLEKCEQVIAQANKMGMKTQTFFIFGKPEETEKDIENTISLAIRLESTLAFFNMLVPYPGTLDFQSIFSGIPLASIDWHNFVAIGKNSVVSHANKNKINLEKALYSANKRFYGRFKQIIHILSRIKTFEEFKAYCKG